MGKECLYHSSFKDRLKLPCQTEQQMEIINVHAQNLDTKSRETTESDSSHCSVASSRSYSAIDMSFDKIVPFQNIRGNPVDDAQSSHEQANGWHTGFPSNEEVAAAEVHEVELYAYVSVLRVLYASGPLSWDQEVLLTNLRLSLHVSNDEHIHELRRLFSTQSI